MRTSYVRQRDLVDGLMDLNARLAREQGEVARLTALALAMEERVRGTGCMKQPQAHVRKRLTGEGQPLN